MKTGNGRYTDDTRRKINRQRNEHKAQRNKELLRLCKDAPCTDCGGSFPTHVMEFDHVPSRGAKLFNVSGTRINHKSMKVLREEIAKCDVVCSNCHSTRTHERRHTVKALGT